MGAALSRGHCLVTGERGPVAKLHPSIKNVWGAQSSGASIVSFNAEAYESYNHKQGDNAPVSEAATFAYTTALNRFLEKNSGHRIQIGDASVVFWADASEANKAAEAENIFAGFWDEGDDEPPPGIDEASEAQKIRGKLDMIRQGQPLAKVAPELTEGVRFYVLGLAPNAARLSMRFYFEDDFGAIAANYQRFLADMRIEPPHSRNPHPALWKYLVETAVLKKRENVPPNLAGEWMRAILAGGRYPQTLFSTVLMRLRADKDVNALRVAILKALLIRNCNKKDTPVALKPDYPNKGYQLGRLFAVYERIQSDALGGKVNATIKDKFYGSASAQPRKVFALLEKGSANHLSKMGKQSPGRKVNLEKLVGEIMGAMDPAADPFPNALPAEDQALFGLGYYHQRNEFFKSAKNGAAAEEIAQ
jgi:CRISPR-associated protein Csd1